MSNHVATVQLMYEAFGKGDIAALAEHFDDSIQWEQWADNVAQKAGVPWMKPRQGKEEAIAFFTVVAQMVVIKEFTVLSIMGNDTQVASEFVIAFDVPSTGGYCRDEEVHLWTFNADGKVIRMRHYTDTAKHIKAAGL